MSEKKKIAVVGSYAVGMTITTDHFPVAGETVLGSNFQVMHGGKGSNQAVAASRLGGHVIYGGCVGRDSFGDMAFRLYEEEGMDAAYLRRSDTGMSTGVGLIYVNQEGENEIVIDFAANKELAPKDIDAMLPALKDCSLLLMQLEIALDTVVYAAKKCNEIGLPFVLNPAPYQKMPKELLCCCDYLTPNQTEGRQILGLQADDPIADEEVAKRIHEAGVKTVILTLGSEGALLYSETRKKRVGGLKVDVVDTTGAGDTFSAGLCVALAEGKDVEEAVYFGNTAAGLAVTKYGVIDSIPYRKEVEEHITSKQ